MAKEDQDEPKALVGISASDLFGFGKAGSALIEAISLGVGHWWAPRQQERIGKAERDNFRAWVAEIKAAGLTGSKLELSVSQRALVRLAASEDRAQVNREAVAQEAIENFREEFSVAPSFSDENLQPLDIDWLDHFWRLAQNISDRDMQTVWGRVLSRSTSGIATYSPRTLHTLSMISRPEAHMLERMAAVTISRPHDGAAILTGFSGLTKNHGVKEDVAQEANRQLSLSCPHINSALFGSIGILIESGWAHHFTVPPIDSVSIQIGAKRFALTGVSAIGRPPHFVDIGSGHGYSPVGQEIISLISVEPNEDYLAAFTNGLKLVGIQLSAET